MLPLRRGVGREGTRNRRGRGRRVRNNGKSLGSKARVKTNEATFCNAGSPLRLWEGMGWWGEAGWGVEWEVMDHGTARSIKSKKFRKQGVGEDK